MEQRTCCFLMAVLHIIIWTHASTMSLASHDDDDVVPKQDTTVPDLSGLVNFDSKQGGVESSNGGSEETYSSRRMVGRVGSRPPNCERKCGDCTPCVATEIPATTDKLAILYTNYEPEGWKCKCGSSFFNP